MALVLADRVRETTTTTGTGTVSLAGPVSGFQGFSTGVGNANTTYYTIVDAATGAWEVGLGTYTSSGSTLSRDTVFASSNSGSLVPFAAGTKDVFVTQPAERAVYVLGAGTGLAAGAAAFTSNGVVYANSTSGLTTGSALTFDTARLSFIKASNGRSWSPDADDLFVVENSTTANLDMRTSTTGGSYVMFSDTDARARGYVAYLHSSDSMPFAVAGSQQMRLTSSGLLINTTSAVSGSKLVVASADATIYGITVGRGAGAVSSNTAVGGSALAANTTGYASVAVGNGALVAQTTGFRNVGVGESALSTNQTGQANTAMGHVALAANTASYNTAFGAYALFLNSTASQGTAVGYQAGYSNTTGGIDAVGYSSLRSNTTGVYNAAFGNQALYSNTTAGGNTAFGAIVLYANTTGAENVGVGGSLATSPALRNNTTGSYNVAVGAGSLASNTTASNNTAVGYQAGYAVTTGEYNTYIGGAAAYSATTGTRNTFIGYGSGTSVTTGDRNTILGRYNGNQGGLDIRTASNYIVLSDGDGNPRQIIDSSGNLGIGTSLPLARLNTYQVNGGGDANILFQNFSTTTNTAVALYLSPTNGSLTAGSIRSVFIKGINVGGGVTALTFGTNSSGADPTEKMRLDASGNLGLGVTPSAWRSTDVALQVRRAALWDDGSNAMYLGQNVYENTSGSYIYIGSDYASIYRQQDGAHAFYTAPSGTAGNAITFTQAMTLDASGNLIVGSTSALTSASGRGNITVNGTDAVLAFGNSNSSAGYIYAASTNLEISAASTRYINFLTNGSERARITSGGDLLVGTTTTRGRITSEQSGGDWAFGINHTNAGTQSFVAFRYAGTLIGQITGNNTNTSYTTSSDYRLKENIQPMTGALAKVAALKPVTYKWKSDGSNGEGFIAHELAEVCPGAVSGEKDAVNEDGSIKPQGIDTSFLVATLTAAIQELKAEFDAYKATHP